MSRSPDASGWLSVGDRLINLRNIREIRKRHHMKEFFLSIVMESGCLIDVACTGEPDLDALLRPTPLPLKRIVRTNNDHGQ